jgi:hypothetical protein
MKQTTLWRFIKSRDDLLAGKLIELHALVTEWLSYIPATFPHYTRHTVAHSEQIIDQVSKFLFKDDDELAPVLGKLSPMEAYIICVSAMLHDSGMVVSDEEKKRIVSSDEWISWASDNGTAKHWSSIKTMREEAESTKNPQAYFNADILTRHLIAEFIRREHHSRAAKLVFSAQTELARFAFDDPILLHTVADVCEAHGLPFSQLEDNSRFPDRRTIRGYDVNVRFVATALRLGDLLDMSSDRACPLIMGAGCPLPLESIAHWTQYQRITHRLTAPDAIELTAECQSQDEHRYLYDWCSWLVDELEATAPLANKWKRHLGWKPPFASLEGPNRTIVVRPSPAATYIPSDWSIQLDKSAVLNLLTGQLYESGFAFLRELVQNAVDATRCRLSAEVTSRGEDLPEYLIDVDSRLREAMPISITLDSVKIRGELLEADADHQLVTVSDAGVGMTSSVIERFFLQVGRSYYKTEEFKRAFKFTPTSRFGIGFLSCFGVSDHVVVETKPYDPSEAAIRLVLTGPASYVLTEKSSKRTSGTTISVRLRRPIPAEQIEQQLRAWFPALEFPIEIQASSQQRSIYPIEVAAHEAEVPVVGEVGAFFVVRSVPFRREGLIGRLFVFVQKVRGAERWDRHTWAHQTYREMHPSENPPVLPESIVSFHGAAVFDRRYQPSGSFAEHVDIRGPQYEIAASRSHFHARGEVPGYQKVVDGLWNELLAKHLAESAGKFAGDWKYLNRLYLKRGSTDFWRAQKCVPLTVDGVEHVETAKSVELMGEIAIAGIPHGFAFGNRSQKQRDPMDFAVPYVDSSNHVFLAAELKKQLLKDRALARIEILPGGNVMSVWSHSASETRIKVDYSSRIVLCEFSRVELVGAAVLSSIEWEETVLALNSRHEFSRYLLAVLQIADAGASMLTSWHADHLLELIKACVEYASKVKELTEFAIRLVSMEASLDGFSMMLATLKSEDFVNTYVWRDGKLPPQEGGGAI